MKKLFSSLVLIVSGIGATSLAHAVTISTAIPGTTPNGTSSSPGAFVANFYNFALIIGGVLAFGVIIYGGIKYMTSGGNPSGASDAKEWIEAALIGLLLLAGAYFILGVVNPQLLNLNLPTLNGANVAATSGTSACSGNTIGTCPSGQTCTSTGIGGNGYVCQAAITSSNDGTACGQNGNQGVCPTGQSCNQVAGFGWTCQGTIISGENNTPY